MQKNMETLFKNIKFNKLLRNSYLIKMLKCVIYLFKNIDDLNLLKIWIKKFQQNLNKHDM